MKSESKRRVVITGAGVICAIGQTMVDFQSNLFEGLCGIKEIDLFDTAGYTCRLGGQIDRGNLKERLLPRQTKRISRCDLLGLIAAREAVSNSRMDFERADTERTGVVMGGGAGGMLSWEKFRRDLWQGRPKNNASRVLASSPCTLTDLIANHHGISGVRSTITTACSSSANAIGYGYDLIRSGDVDLVVTGGSEALSELTFAGFNSLKVMSPEPCRPFDKHRRGLSLGEGAGIVILEEYTHALERGAGMLAEMAGYAVNADAYHMTSPDPEGLGMFRVMSSALERAGIETERVDYINAHGTATKINDHMETRAIQRLFGKKNLERITVSSTKSMVGHCLGASGAIEAVATILALDQQAAPPTVHLDEPDPLCNLNHVTDLFRKQKILVALSNSFAFGGNNTSLVFKKLT
ncbi:MAG: beta-ketoacyl-[acyl-carrier-protein] synthase family protein [Desulfobacterales bacterium]|nr:beta-ketoacyl-[acyl-carrier-protein] synthase family protein [Desulfobacterales bacterium]MDX2512958.1 beta-ketoacyl-[acyl-carrier-protein] synthase family protein [Desulfobacterales bacterium]